MRVLALALLVALSALALAPSGAGASTIVHTCGPKGDLCTVDPDSGKRGRLTKDGSYGYPSMSRDGRVLAFMKGTRVYVANGKASGRRHIKGAPYIEPRLRPDGKALLVDVFSMGFSGRTCIITLSSGRRRCSDRTQWLRWGTSSWLWGHSHEHEPWVPTLCQVKLGSEDCAGRVIFKGTHEPFTLSANSAVSPNGRSIAVEQDPWGDDVKAQIVVFDTRTLKRVRRLTTGASYDSQPVWSPDGRRILFVRDHHVGGPDGYTWELWTVPVRGGKARRLVKGGSTPGPVEATWGA